MLPYNDAKTVNTIQDVLLSQEGLLSIGSGERKVEGIVNIILQQLQVENVEGVDYLRISLTNLVAAILQKDSFVKVGIIINELLRVTPLESHNSLMQLLAKSTIDSGLVLNAAQSILYKQYIEEREGLLNIVDGNLNEFDTLTGIYTASQGRNKELDLAESFIYEVALVATIIALLFSILSYNEISQEGFMEAYASNLIYVGAFIAAEFFTVVVGAAKLNQIKENPYIQKALANYDPQNPYLRLSPIQRAILQVVFNPGIITKE